MSLDPGAGRQDPNWMIAHRQNETVSAVRYRIDGAIRLVPLRKDLSADVHLHANICLLARNIRPHQTHQSVEAYDVSGPRHKQGQKVECPPPNRDALAPAQ